ncbi:MAG: NAD(P)H-hydrate dehydratase [Chloroflexi bacterium]|nr:NAD(P)H-hydrate dehydratase [Chloroflexota bacterium]
MFPGAKAVGTLVFATAGVEADLPGLGVIRRGLVDDAYVRSALPARPLNANKGTFGKVLVVGGSSHYVGAPGLAARAAYRMGAGLVTVAAPRAVTSILAAGISEPTWLPCDELNGTIAQGALSPLLEALPQYDALVLGPGLGQGPQMPQLITGLMGKASELDCPVIVDADALNALATVNNWPSFLPQHAVLTPHPGEMSRLTGLSIESIQENRLEIAQEYATQWNTTVLLKGAHTVIASPDRLSVLPYKSSALSTAGTGDVLAGMIGALLGQRLSPHDAAAAAGYLHGLSGVHAAGGSDRSVMAGDLIDALRDVLRQIEAL